MLGRREGVALRLHIKRLHAYRPIPHLDPATRSPSIGPAATRPKAHYPGQNRGSPQTTMKHLLLTTIAAVVLVGCGEAQLSPSSPEAKTVTKTAKPEPLTAKVPDIAIYEAAREGNIEAVKQHIAAGTDVNAKDNDGWTPLFIAAGKGHKEIVELLLANGAEVNAKGDGGVTPLHFATIKEIAELLIAKGADVNAKDDAGVTPLLVAAASGYKEITELLLADGADVSAKIDDGRTPLDLAILNKQPELADLLRKHGGKTGEELKAEGK